MSHVIPTKCLYFLEISRVQNASEIMKNHSQGIIFVVISCQSVVRKNRRDCALRFLKAASWQNRFFTDFFLEPPIFARILSPDCFSSFLWEEVPRKILQENARQIPPKLQPQKSPTRFLSVNSPALILSEYSGVSSTKNRSKNGKNWLK